MLHVFNFIVIFVMAVEIAGQNKYSAVDYILIQNQTIVNKNINNNNNNTNGSKSSSSLHHNSCNNKIFFNHIRAYEIKYLIPLDRFPSHTECNLSLLYMFDLKLMRKKFPKKVGKSGCQVNFHKIIKLIWLVNFTIGYVKILNIYTFEMEKVLVEFEHGLQEFLKILNSFTFDYDVTDKVNHNFYELWHDVFIVNYAPANICAISRFIYTYIDILLL